MDEVAPAQVSTAPKAAKKKVTKPKKTGPSVKDLVLKAMAASKERKGVSLAALKKALAAGGYDVEKNNARVNTAVKSLVTNETLVQVKGTGASGSFKMNKPVKKAAPKAKKPAAAKKAKTVKKPIAAKKAKKPAAAKKAVKSPKKVTKAPKSLKMATKAPKSLKMATKAPKSLKMATKASKSLKMATKALKSPKKKAPAKKVVKPRPKPKPKAKKAAPKKK